MKVRRYPKPKGLTFHFWSASSDFDGLLFNEGALAPLQTVGAADLFVLFSHYFLLSVTCYALWASLFLGQSGLMGLF